MTDNKARAEVELGGTQQVVSDVAKMQGAFARFGAAASASLKAGAKDGTVLGNTLSGLTRTLSGLAASGLQASGAIRTLDVGAGVAGDKAREKSLAQLAQTSTKGRNELKGYFTDLERTSGVSQAALTGVAATLATVTNDTDFAVDSLGALTDVAASLGREAGSEIPLFAALHNGLGITDNAKDKVEQLAAAAQALGVIGGPRSLFDSIAALGPELQGLKIDTDKDREAFVALFGAVTKGAKTPQEAAGRFSSVLQSLQGDASKIQYSSGGKFGKLDDKGRLVDALGSFQFVQDYTSKKFGGNAAARERALVNDYGPVAGTAFSRANLKDARQRLASVGGGTSVRDAASALQSSDVGQRDQRERAGEGIDRNVGNVFNRFTDATNRAIGPRAAAAVSTVLGTFGNDIIAGAGGKGEGKGDAKGGYVGKLVSTGVGLLGGAALADLGSQYEQQDQLRGRLAKGDKDYATQQSSSQPSQELVAIAGGNEALAQAIKDLPRAMAQELANKILKVRSTGTSPNDGAQQ